MLKSLALAAIAFMTTATLAVADPESPFGPRVLVLEPGDPGAGAKVEQIYREQEKAQFGNGRYAILLKPGKHNAEFALGFYTHLAGLGRLPKDVDINGGVTVNAGWMKANATLNFWRGAENFTATQKDGRPNLWAVSQATFLRRAHFKSELTLAENGWSSGGYLADSRVDGQVQPGSQQQWFARNSTWRRWTHGVFNMVFLGCENAPSGEWPEKAFTKIAKTPVIREKPYLVFDDNAYSVVVPALRRDASGPTWDDSRPGEGKTLALSEFYIATSEKDTAATLNAQLATGKNLLLTPGIYQIDAALKVVKENQIIFGLGYATLMPINGTPAVQVADVSGVTLCGLLLDAGEKDSPTLLEVGQPGSEQSHAENPTFLFDIFCRVGGAAVGKAKAMVTINSRDAVVDHFWLWRADHGAGVAWDKNTNANGLIVNGENVTAYGLFVEHCQEHQVLWNANGGRVIFYQSELPYDPPSNDGWGNGGKGFPSYKVADSVTTHDAQGLGIYSVFINNPKPVTLYTAAEAPEKPGVKFRNIIICNFNGQNGSTVTHTLNNRGNGAGKEFSSKLLK